ncbi:MAG: metallophosphoesterase [Cystobacter sp.]
MASTPSPSEHPIAYLTDVEGLWEKLADFCRDNPQVSLDAGGRLVIRPGATFIHGGDALDRGPDGRRVVRTLLEAWRAFPGQVVLLAGNRDINKLRLWRELKGHPLPRTPAEFRGASRPVLLKWIFDNTMGARGAFEFRQAELERDGPVSEEAVVDSFLEDLAPGGVLRDYLAACQLAHRVGNTLFVHGGVSEESLGFVPSRDRVEGVDAWREALNGWYAEQVAAFVEGRLNAGVPAWAPLIAYQAPTPGRRINPKSVVYGRMATADNHPQLPSRSLIAALADAGIHRLVAGHTPSGDCPSILREGGFELILADNSYGRVEGASRVFLRDDSVHVEGRVVLEGGRTERVRFQLALDDASTPIGRQLLDTGQLVKAPLVGSGDWLLFRALPGFQVEQLAASPADIAGRPLGSARA